MNHLPTVHRAFFPGTLVSPLPVLPQIGCLTCGVVISGLAKVGNPCPFCDDTLRDLELEILMLSALYDGARWCFLQSEAQRL